MLTLQECLHRGQVKLIGQVAQPHFEAEILLAHALGQPRTYLFSQSNKTISATELATYDQYLRRRCQQEPIAYMFGRREFWSLEFLVNEDTLIPRPETELLIETALQMYSADTLLKVADLGTGCGAIALALASERPLWDIYATDISEAALKVAQENATRLHLKQVKLIQGDWCHALPLLGFDLIISNPPYIAAKEWENYAKFLRFEPLNALVSGEDGLVAIRQISQSAKRYLKPRGCLLMEHGFAQGGAVREVFGSEGYSNICSLSDLSGLERVTIGRF